MLVGNVGTITGGIQAFDDAKPDDGWLEVGVATAQGARSGRARWAGWRSAGPTPRRSCSITRARRSTIGSASRWRTSWTAAPATRPTGSRPTWSRSAITVCVP